MILVTGATGNVGAELVRVLQAQGAPLRALVHRSAPPELAGVSTFVGDLDDPPSLVPGLAGIEAAFLLPGYHDMATLLETMKAVGVRRVVQLSGGSAGSGDMSNAVTAYMVRSEQAVYESGLEWTVLRPAAFMANALRWVPQLAASDAVRLPFASVRAAVLDPADLAAVAAACLTSDAHAGRVYYPTGPESLTPSDQVEILGRVLGRALRFEAQPDDEARVQMLETTPPEYVDAFFDFYVAGSLDESVVRSTVHDVTGRSPRTFEQWARAHQDAFA